jgi:hypothetical protein
MTTYQTNNPLGSTAVKDLYDNAENFDNWANGESESYPDRFGTMRLSLEGMRAAVSAFLEASGFQFIGDYGAGLSVSTYTQIFRYNGEYWRAAPSTTLPYVLTGVPATDIPLFVSTGDAAIRSALALTNDLTQGSALVGRAIQVVANKAEALTTSKNSPSKYVMILNDTVTNDGGGGLYRIDVSDTTSPSNGGTLLVMADGGRLKWVPQGRAQLELFGAKGDGVTDDSAAAQACMAALGYVYLAKPGATYVIGDLTLGSNQHFTAKSKVTVKCPAAASYAVRVTAFGIGTYAFISGIKFDLSACPTTTVAIQPATSSGVVFGLRVTNCDFTNCGAAYQEEVHATNYIVDAYFQDCICYFSRGLQFFSRRSRGFFTLRDFKVDHTYNPGQVTWGGVRFDDFIGVELEKVDVVGPVQPASVYQASAIGMQFNGVPGSSASIWLRRVLIDNTRGPGLGISNCHNVFGIDTCVFQNLGPAIDFTNVSKSQFVNTKVVGGLGLSGAPAGSNGITLTNCSNVNFNGHAVESNTGNGFVMSSCTDCSATDGYSNGNTNVGYLEVTAATRNLRSGVRAISNGTGSITQIGAQSASMSYWPNSGTFVAQTAGPATII